MSACCHFLGILALLVAFLAMNIDELVEQHRGEAGMTKQGDDNKLAAMQARTSFTNSL